MPEYKAEANFSFASTKELEQKLTALRKAGGKVSRSFVALDIVFTAENDYELGTKTHNLDFLDGQPTLMRTRKTRVVAESDVPKKPRGRPKKDAIVAPE